MLHEARDRQKFVSDVQYLRDMQHKVDSEYQACLKRQEYKKDPNEKTQDQLWGKDTSDRSRFSSGSSSKQEDGLLPDTALAGLSCRGRCLYPFNTTLPGPGRRRALSAAAPRAWLLRFLGL
ncbi:probable E3 ubiquitin-protein ligase MARCHF10 isoform X1 [Peromyscus eremicus]|uniref:probable E3 ubiquitin-protein ligase MARCHF10 isoform X1 n=1 Tax=Peromyscus eremicus TaxID=42410 RepID=UPI0027DDA1B3|nr:probable E3 ubiquitin-protein ligase MARCHF10 isoform X1 [Peromyscus eremicus]XP_059127932.1 probable E3 ubiquitin-protein ligase MARCHF10 isoform X1 [Peromyscus eremicus]